MTTRQSSTVSPPNRSRSHGGITEAGGVEERLERTNQSVRMDDGHVDAECLPVEEGEESIELKVLPTPSPPSRQEMLEHNLTHWPFRSWCKHCVAGKAKASGHRSTGNTGASEIPIISMDYAFMGDKDAEAEEDESIDADALYDRNESDDSKVKILVARDSKSRVCAAIPVPRKGVDQEDWNLKESL